MFIFPVMKGNLLAEALELALMEFWIPLFKDPEYQTRALASHRFWGTRLEDGRFYRHAFLHRSDEDKKPINLDESRWATRLLSIHASKGQGCEVVFLLDMSESTLLRCFSGGERNLVYESLLHVAVTRQKLRLHLGIVGTHDDDIRLRFERGCPDVAIDASADFELSNKTTVKVDQVVKFACSSPVWSNALHETYFATRALRSFLPAEDGSDGGGDLVEWGHHVIRLHVMFYMLLCSIYDGDSGNDGGDDGDNGHDGGDGVHRAKNDIAQIFVVLHGFVRSLPRSFHLKEYRKELFEIIDKKKSRVKYTGLPLLRFTGARQGSQYHVYCDALMAIIARVQAKLKRTVSRLPDLCPLEACVLVHALELRDHGPYSDFSAMELLDLICSMHAAGALSAELHGGWDCICSTTCLGIDPCTGAVTDASKDAATDPVKVSTLDEERARKLRESVTKHYMVVARVNTMYASFERHLLDTLIAIQTRREKNATLFRGKRVHVCVFTFSSPEPIWLDLHLDDPSDMTGLLQCIRAAFVQHFRRTNDSIWRLWKRCFQGAPQVGDMSAGAQARALKHMLEELQTYEAPAYAFEYFRGMQKRARRGGGGHITRESIQEDFEETLDVWLDGLV